MKKGIMKFEEHVYTDVTDEEFGSLIIDLENKRDPSDGTPLTIEPEVDGTYTVTKKVWVSSEWDDGSVYGCERVQDGDTK